MSVGKKIFRKLLSMPQNMKEGGGEPNLHGLFRRRTGEAKGHHYSEANKEETLESCLKKELDRLFERSDFF